MMPGLYMRCVGLPATHPAAARARCTPILHHPFTCHREQVVRKSREAVSLHFCSSPLASFPRTTWAEWFRNDGPALESAAEDQAQEPGRRCPLSYACSGNRRGHDACMHDYLQALDYCFEDANLSVACLTLARPYCALRPAARGISARSVAALRWAKDSQPPAAS